MTMRLARHAAAAAALCAVSTAPALAGGYELEAQSAELLGTANAGKSALADSAATLFWNPAGMTRLREGAIALGLTRLDLSLEFEDRGSTDATGAPMRGSRREQGVSPAVIPAFAIALPLNDRTSVGLSIQSKYGLVTDYGDTWAGRYHATYSELSTLNVNPAIAHRIDEHWSIGGGIALQHAYGRLESRIDFGSAAYGILGPAVAAAAGFTPQGNDGAITVEGSDLSAGITAGVLYEHDARTRCGLGFRSRIQHTLHGDADFDVPAVAAPLTATGLFANSDADTRIATPETLTLSGYHELDDRLALVGDVTWSNWSIVEELVTKFDNPAQPDNGVTADWHDTYRVSVGAIYRLDDAWTLRAGVARAPSPTNNRPPLARLPDSDRMWYTLGASYRWTESTTLDLNVAFVDQKDAPVNVGSPTAGSLRGEADWDVHWVSVGLRVDF